MAYIGTEVILKPRWETRAAFYGRGAPASPDTFFTSNTTADPVKLFRRITPGPGLNRPPLHHLWEIFLPGPQGSPASRARFLSRYRMNLALRIFYRPMDRAGSTLQLFTAAR